MDIVRKIDLIKNAVNEELRLFESILPTIDNILSKGCERGWDEIPVIAVDKLISSFNTVKEASETFVKDLNDIGGLTKPVVPWPDLNKTKILEMFHLDGHSPWSIWLTQNPSEDIDRIYRILDEKHSKGLLKKLKNPKVGDFICCYDKKILFRALIIDVSNTRIKVINVDKYNKKIIKLDSCYELTKDMCEVHTYSIQCCLIKDKRMEGKWNEDLGQLFQSILKECRLTVRIIEEIPSFPPLFLVEMYAFNEALEVETNISHWISSHLLPELNKSFDDNDHILENFSDEALDPFLLSSNAVPTLEASILDNNKENSSLPTSLNELLNVNLQNVALEESFHKLKPRNRLAHLMNAKKEGELGSCSAVSIKSNVDSYLQDKSTSNINFSDMASSSKSEINRISSGVVHEEEEKKNGESNSLNGFYDHLLFEDSVIPNNYIPKDESRICAFYAKKGYCWKPACRKEHSKIIGDRWTLDSAELFKESLNTLNLPSVGSIVTLKVTYVVLCNVFYALLPDCFSDTGDGSETAESLNKSLNSPETKREFKLLSSPPCLGQLLIAYCVNKSLWLRAVVRDVYDRNMIQVFFVDFGLTEELPLDKCYEIGPQFTHLPRQAVYCTLANVFVLSPEGEEGKSYLNSMLIDQEIEAHVIDCDLMNSHLEILAFHNGVNINQKLIDLGYCSSFKRWC